MRVAAIETEAEAEAERNPWKDRLAIFNMRSIEWLGMHVPRPAGLRVASVAFAALHRAQRDGQREVVAAEAAALAGADRFDLAARIGKMVDLYRELLTERS